MSKEISIFISSRFYEFAELRAKIIKEKFSKLDVGLTLNMLDDRGGIADVRSPAIASIEEAGDSDIFILLLGETYKEPLDDEKSYTHLEYDMAIEKGLNILAFPIGDVYNPANLKLSDNPVFGGFQKSILENSNHITAPYTPTEYSVDKMYEKIYQSLKEHIGKLLKIGIKNSNKKEENLHHITHDKLNEILKLLPTSINKEQFLQEYFGDDWQKVLQNPQTYKNLKLKLKNAQYDTQKLLTERKELLEKIASTKLKSSIQKMVDQAFKELRYEDVRTLLDEFIANNQAIGDDLIKAHFQKAMSYIEEIEYFKAKEEFEKYIPVGIEDANIQNEYGVLYNTLGDYDKSLEHSELSLKLAIKEFGENHSRVATRYNNIGSAWDSKGEYDKAIEFYNRALKIRVATLGENHPSTATSYNNIGSAWKSKGEYDKAIEFYNRALKIRLATLGENHPSTANSYNNIGWVWRSKGEYDKAIEFYNRALEIYLATLGENHPSTATSYNNIALIYFNNKEYKKAYPYAKKVVKIRELKLPANHPNLINSKMGLEMIEAKLRESRGD